MRPFDDPEAGRAKIPDNLEAFLAEVEARVNKATPGPWTQPLEDEPRAIAAEQRPRMSLLGVDVDGMAIFEHETDATFVRHARTDIPRLIAIVREQGERIAKYEESEGAWHEATGSHDGADALRMIDALRDRLAKLETVAKRHLVFFSAEDDCDCEGCDISRELDGLLNEKGGA